MKEGLINKNNSAIESIYRMPGDAW
jgi:hypothetical protein